MMQILKIIKPANELGLSCRMVDRTKSLNCKNISAKKFFALSLSHIMSI